MIKNIKPYLFPFLIAFSALSVSASAAFYSVSGLSKLFAGAAVAVIIMAASLEIAKLVIASLLYQYRQTLPKLLKIYLTIAAVVLIGITSMGIYGFLSSAYQETASKSGTIDAKIALIETKRDNIKEQLNVFNAEKSSINKSVTDLRNGLSNNVITYVDAKGNQITSTSSATRKSLEKQLDQATERQTEVNARVDELNNKLFEYENEIVEVSTNNELAGELGPLKYLSGLTGYPMDKIINVLLLVIIFVFDPLAIALVIAANFAFAQLKKKEYPLEEQVEDMRKVVDTYDDLNELISQEETNHHEYDENNLESKIDSLTYKHNSLIEYLSNIIEIPQNKEDMKLFNFFKKKQDPIIKETPTPTIESNTLQWDDYGNPEPIIEPEVKVEAPKLDINNDNLINNEDLIKVRAILNDPTLPEYKKGYWKGIEERLVKKLEASNNDDTITIF
jgi:flagellar biosynthesis chaperone FliJ